MARTQQEIHLIHVAHQERDEYLKKKLEALGVTVTIQTFTGDSSFPVEYTFSGHGVSGLGPTFDMGMIEWLEKVLKSK